jgi:hypothetical protein
VISALRIIETAFLALLKDAEASDLRKIQECDVVSHIYIISKSTRCWRAGEAGPARQLDLPASSPARPRQLASRQLLPNCDHPKTKFVFRKRMYS